MRPVKALGALLVVGLLAACGSPAGNAQKTADSITNAAINNNADAVSAPFDSALKSKVTRAQVGAISDQMNKLGAYQGLTLLATDSTKSEYTFRAKFAKGTMNVVERLDPNGQVAAYRIFPTANT